MFLLFFNDTLFPEGFCAVFTEAFLVLSLVLEVGIEMIFKLLIFNC